MERYLDLRHLDFDSTSPTNAVETIFRAVEESSFKDDLVLMLTADYSMALYRRTFDLGMFGGFPSLVGIHPRGGMSFMGYRIVPHRRCA